MVNLSIRLAKPGDKLGSFSGRKSTSGKVAKGGGVVEDVVGLDIVGRRANRVNGRKVHFCSSCDFPIAIYGRLEPCHHVFCLCCTAATKSCYICKKPFTSVEEIDYCEGLFICGVPGCLVSFLSLRTLLCHVGEDHADLKNKPKPPEPLETRLEHGAEPSNPGSARDEGQTGSVPIAGLVLPPAGSATPPQAPGGGGAPPLPPGPYPMEPRMASPNHMMRTGPMDLSGNMEGFRPMERGMMMGEYMLRGMPMGPRGPMPFMGMDYGRPRGPMSGPSPPFNPNGGPPRPREPGVEGYGWGPGMPPNYNTGPTPPWRPMS